MDDLDRVVKMAELRTSCEVLLKVTNKLSHDASFADDEELSSMMYKLDKEAREISLKVVNKFYKAANHLAAMEYDPRKG